MRACVFCLFECFVKKKKVSNYRFCLHGCKSDNLLTIQQLTFHGTDCGGIKKFVASIFD